MHWIERVRDELAASSTWGYHGPTPPASEPTALAALALLGIQLNHGAPAGRACRWLLDMQNANGSVGVDATHPAPCWPTGWAVMAWQRADAPAMRDARRRAIAWLLSVAGRPTNPEPGAAIKAGHDTTLCGWPWVESTHSWVEPTAIGLLALRCVGQADDARAREAVGLLLDRQLPGGGWNYGNTIVLGNTLRPHIQPTGLALWALAEEPSARERVQPSIEYLQKTLDAETATASLCYAMLGLTALGARPAQAQDWLDAAAERTLQSPSPYQRALLLLAAGVAK